MWIEFTLASGLNLTSLERGATAPFYGCRGGRKTVQFSAK